MIYYDEIYTITDADQEETEELTEELTEESTEEIATSTDALILQELQSTNENLYNFYQVFVFAFLVFIIFQTHKILHYAMKRHTDM